MASAGGPVAGSEGGSGFGLRDQLQPQSAANKEPKMRDPAPEPSPVTNTVTNTITRTIHDAPQPQQPPPVSAGPVTGSRDDPVVQAAIEKLHGPGGARDPFAGEDTQAPAEAPPQQSPDAQDRNAAAAQAAFEGRQVPEGGVPPVTDISTEASQSELDQATYAKRGEISTESSQAELAQAAADRASTQNPNAVFEQQAATQRANLLANAGLTEDRLAQLMNGAVEGTTEEQIIASGLAINKGFMADVIKRYGGQINDSGTQLTEALTGQGEHVLGGGTGQLNGLERAAKAVQAGPIAAYNIAFTPMSYATSEVAQTAIMAGPLAPRFWSNMQAAGLDPSSPDSPNMRLEIVNQTLMDAYLHGTQAEANWAAPILVTKGYLEFIAGGGAHMLQSGVDLARNAARMIAANRAGAALSSALRQSGGLTARSGGEVTSVASRFASIAPGDVRMQAIAERLMVQARLATAEKPASAFSRFVTDEAGAEKGPLGSVVSAVADKVGSIEYGPVGTISGTNAPASGKFFADGERIVVDRDSILASAHGQAKLAGVITHEMLHWGQWVLQARRDPAKWAAMDDVERLPSQVQEIVQRIMGYSKSEQAGVGKKAGSVDPNLAALWPKAKNSIADALGKFVKDEAGAGVRPTGEEPQTYLSRYADNALAARKSDNARIAADDARRAEMMRGTDPSIARNDATQQSNLLADEKFNGQASPAPLPADSTSAQHGDAVHQLTNDNGGATYSLKNGDMTGTDAWAVGAYPERAVTVPGHNATPGDYTKFIDDNRAVLERGDVHVGTYKDPKTGNTVLDLVKVPGADQFAASRMGSVKTNLTNSRAAARQQAIQIAKENGQQSIYNLRTGKTVQTPREAANPLDVAGIKQRIQEKGTPELFDKARKWYSSAREFARSLSNEADFAPNEIPLRNVAVAMAGLSPQNEWSGVGKMDNMKAIYKMVRAYNHGVRDVNELFDTESGLNMNGAQVKKAWAALTSKGDPMDSLVAPKERSFALNIMGERDLATVDKHIAKGQISLGGKEAGLTAPEHDRIQSAYQQVLTEGKADGSIPADTNVRDIQALDWGLLSGNDLGYTHPDTMFPGTPPENLPYDVAKGVGREEGAASPAAPNSQEDFAKQLKNVRDQQQKQRDYAQELSDQVHAKGITLSPEAIARRQANAEASSRVTDRVLKSGRAELDRPLGDASAPSAPIGQMDLTHYSKQAGLSELDPAKEGTGTSTVSASEANRRGEAGYLPRTHYYKDGTEPEYAVTSTAQNRYQASVPESSIYDMTADPLGIRKQLSGIKDNAQFVTAVEGAIHDAGYAGYHIPGNAQLSGHVVMFDKQAVTPTSAAAPRAPMGGLTSKAFAGYKSIGDVVRVLKDTGFNGIADFSEAVKNGKGLEGVPSKLIEDFSYAHIERAIPGMDETGVGALAKRYAEASAKGEGQSLNDIITEHLTGKPKGDGPSAAAPSSPLSMGKDGGGEPELTPPKDGSTVGGISGIGMDKHGSIGYGDVVAEEQTLGMKMADTGLPIKESPATEAAKLEPTATGDRTGTPLGLKTEGGLTVKPSAQQEAPLMPPSSGADRAGTPLGLKTEGGLTLKSDTQRAGEVIEPSSGKNRLGTPLGLKVEGSAGTNVKEAIMGFNNFERSLEASTDDSFVLNQGFYSMFSHPKEFSHMFVDSFKAMSSGKGLARVNQEVNALPSHDLAVRSGVHFDNLGDSEFFQSQFLEHLTETKLPGNRTLGDVPVVGGAARVSETMVVAGDRAYTGAGNSLRGRIFDGRANAWGLMDVSKMEIGSPELMKAMKLASDLGDYTNIITGIGDVSMLPEVLQKIGPLFFAYKFMASKFNQLTGPFTYTMQALRGSMPSRLSMGERSMPTPLYLSPEHASSWRMAGLAWRDLTLYAGGIGLEAAAMKALGVDVGLDPNQDSKFLQVQFGTKNNGQVWDLSGGMGKVFSLMYQTMPVLGSRQHVTHSGKSYSLDNVPFGQEDASELWIRFLEGKLGPMYSQGLQYLRNKNYQGSSPSAWDLLPMPIAAKQVIEMFYSESWKDPGSWAANVGQVFGAHGYVNSTTSEPPGPLGQPIKDLFGGNKPKFQQTSQ